MDNHDLHAQGIRLPVLSGFVPAAGLIRRTDLPLPSRAPHRARRLATNGMTVFLPEPHDGACSLVQNMLPLSQAGADAAEWGRLVPPARLCTAGRPEAYCAANRPSIHGAWKRFPEPSLWGRFSGRRPTCPGARSTQLTKVRRGVCLCCGRTPDTSD